MNMSMGSDADHGAAACKISMLWNWYTIDACFLASGWHIHNRGMFAVTCIGVTLMAMALEGLRLACRSYDALLMAQWRSHAKSVQRQWSAEHQSTPDLDTSSLASGRDQPGPIATLPSAPMTIVLRPTALQQLIRAILHAATFGLAYILMLLAMYFNGYLILSIIAGAGLGKFAFDWMPTTFTVHVGAVETDPTTVAAQDRTTIQKHHEDAAICC